MGGRGPLHVDFKFGAGGHGFALHVDSKFWAREGRGNGVPSMSNLSLGRGDMGSLTCWF